MQRRTHIQVSSLIIFISIITVMVQFIVYYYFSSILIIWGVACLISFLSCHILLEQTATYEACYQYSLLTLFNSLVITVLSYYGNDQSLLPFTGAMLGILFINWLIPSFHCYLRYMLDYGSKLDDYTTFYRNHSILFLLFYFGIILYTLFAVTAFPSVYRGTLESANVIPFQVITTQIEDYLYELIPLSDVLIYFLSRILLFLPYGFFITLLIRRRQRLLRFLLLLALPFLLELGQYFIIPSRFDIDDLIYALLGGILGSLSFYLQNGIFRTFNGREFLLKETDYPFSSSSLHF